MHSRNPERGKTKILYGQSDPRESRTRAKTEARIKINPTETRTRTRMQRITRT